MAGLGHEDQFPPTSLSARCGFGQGTFAWTHGNGRDAPKAAIHTIVMDRFDPTMTKGRSTMPLGPCAPSGLQS